METLAIAASVGLPDLFSSWHLGLFRTSVNFGVERSARLDPIVETQWGEA